MPHRASQDRPFRARTAALLVGIIAVSLAARSQTGGTAPAQQPPSTPAATDTTKSADSTALQPDSMQVDSMVMDSAYTPQMTMAPAPVAAPTEWPVDPATGQTLINGIPVVGKVFIMQKTDGTRKIESVAQALQGEAQVALPAVVGATSAPAAGQTRRMRGIMIQATLWMNDNKAKAVHNRYYPSTTSGESLGQQY